MELVQIQPGERGGGTCPALAEVAYRAGEVVAVGFVFDGWTVLKNEATLRAYSTHLLAAHQAAYDGAPYEDGAATPGDCGRGDVIAV